MDLSRISRSPSTPLLEAASISMTSSQRLLSNGLTNSNHYRARRPFDSRQFIALGKNLGNTSFPCSTWSEEISMASTTCSTQPVAEWLPLPADPPRSDCEYFDINDTLGFFSNISKFQIVFKQNLVNFSRYSV